MAIKRTMRAAVVEKFGQPLIVKDVPVPTPGPGQALIEIFATGVCHTDLHAADGDWPIKPTPPFIPGHEGAGVVVALGPGVTHLEPHGCSAPADIAITASPDGKRSARSSKTPGIR
jgi:alcohol dehydrogenase, propanol-preferring